VDWPAVHYWRELVALYPRARVILTWRDPESWWKSYEATILRKFRTWTDRESVGVRIIAKAFGLGFKELFGGTGRTGQALLATTLAHGWQVRAFVRTQAGASLQLPPGLVVVHGFADYLPDIVTAVQGTDGVCCLVGTHARSPEPFCAALTQRIVEAMRGERVRRLVCLTSDGRCVANIALDGTFVRGML
jgi:hypothetical protein